MIAGFILWQLYILSYNIAEKIRKSYVKKFRPPTPVQNLRNHLQAYYVPSIHLLYIGRKLTSESKKPRQIAVVVYKPLKLFFRIEPHVKVEKI